MTRILHALAAAFFVAVVVGVFGWLGVFLYRNDHTPCEVGGGEANFAMSCNPDLPPKGGGE